MTKTFEDICKSAEILQQNENYKAASGLFLEALPLSDKPVEKIYVYTSLGKLFQKNKEVEKSIENFEKALPYFEGFKEQVFSEEQAVIHNNLGALYYEKDLTSSIENYQKALDIFNMLRNNSKDQYTAQTGSTHFAMAYALVKNGNNQEAKKHFKEAINPLKRLTILSLGLSWPAAILSLAICTPKNSIYTMHSIIIQRQSYFF
jgi:tetratricopeptide (TPR) repeat protein